MRHSTHRSTTKRPPVGFWQGTFNGKLDRGIARGERAPAVLRRASGQEIIQLLDEARRLVPLGETDSVWRMVAKNPDIIQAVCPKRNAAPEGLFAYLPLNTFGAAMIVSGQ